MSKTLYATQPPTFQSRMKVPSMGFSDHFVQNVQSTPESLKRLDDQKRIDENKLSDQEILESTEEIYFQESPKCDVYILNVCCLHKTNTFFYYLNFKIL